ncbi:MAG: hypothetical protein ACTHMS_12700 [Jatrophihabitans sp.]|uniref:hypothetical protein n=1 Tax=Jatrophihabitans sp. TaxID=1932789 RepID=UPI003F7D0D2F
MTVMPVAAVLVLAGCASSGAGVTGSAASRPPTVGAGSTDGSAKGSTAGTATTTGTGTGTGTTTATATATTTATATATPTSGGPGFGGEPTDPAAGRAVVRLHVGERRALAVPSGTWDAMTTGNSHVVRVDQRGGYPGTEPLAVTLTALAAGRTTLTTTSDAACLHASPRCLLPQRVWSVVVVVG